MTMNDAQIARGWAEQVIIQERVTPSVDVEKVAAAHYILATTTPPTMADVEWDADVHSGLCAEHQKHEVVRMMYQDGEWIDCILPNMSLLMIRTEELTPIPGTRVNLAPTSEPAEDTPEPVSTPDHPEFLETEDDYENAPEGTIVAYGEGIPLVRIDERWRVGDSWVLDHGDMADVRRRVLRWGWEDTVSIESHEEAVPSHPEVLATQEDYENAPEGTIVVGDFCDPWVKDDRGFWLVCGDGGGETSRMMAFASRRVLRWGETL